MMKSHIMTSPGPMKEEIYYSFLMIVSFSLVAICAVTLGVATACVRYKQVAIAFFLLLLAPCAIYALTANSLSEHMVSSEAGFKSLCTAETSDDLFFKTMKNYTNSLDKVNEKVSKWMCSE